MSLNPAVKDWRGQRVWLMGASSGIGAALAQELAARGARVALSARRADVLEGLLPSLKGSWHMVLPCDAAKPDSMVAAREQLMASWGGLDFAIYLAGDYVPLRAWDFTLADMRHLCEVNYLGAVAFSHTVLPLWSSGSPADATSTTPHGLVLVASVAGYRGLPQALGYGPAKAALIQFAEILYLDCHVRDIGVWLVNPGFVATRLTKQNDFKMPALIQVDEAVSELLAGLAQGSFEIHFPKRFTRTMKLLRMLPQWLYFRLMQRFSPADNTHADT